MLDSLNGYKFGFSYHILSNNNIKSFFYYLTGCLVFRLQDIKINGYGQHILIKKINDLNKNKKLIN